MDDAVQRTILKEMDDAERRIHNIINRRGCTLIFSNRMSCKKLKSSTSPDKSTNIFTPDQQERLSRAWIKVVNETTAYDIALTQEIMNDLHHEIGSSFWEWVQEEYTNSEQGGRERSIGELHSQWVSTMPSLVDFLALFCHKWVDSRLSSQDAEASREEAFSSGQNAFKEKHGYPFPQENTARLLVHHAKWRTLIKPLLMPEENHYEQVAKVTMSKLRESPRGVTQRAKSVATNGRSARCVRQCQGNDAEKSTVWAEAGLSRLSESNDEKKLEVMERQLDLDIMTCDEAGLSVEAKEYLRLQRAQILRKIRLQTGQQEQM
ncbi:unnamed protein product [Phytophthora fragariaefolia]|uniref:Unnamed protein product n=1 Tax=Phytophthora fragariaefolia TaxID=1490495 RepID=A0A9W6TJV1_9STRA|nr:unnamed protein product [Phytophthora fragariaefolia]